MKTNVPNPFLSILLLLIAALGWALADRATGQTLTIIYSLNGDDGSAPQGGLIVSGNTLYGTTLQGGGGGNTYGVVFALSTDGTGYTNLHTFLGYDGWYPTAGLVSLGDTMYGTGDGGTFGPGTLFSINTDGTGFYEPLQFHDFPERSSANER